MTINRAFEILKLSITATKEQVEESYKTLIKAHHPDKTNGDGAKAAEINEARETAINYLTETNSSLALIRQFTDIIKVDNIAIQKRIEYKKDSDAIISKIYRRQGSKYKKYKQLAKFSGIASGAMALVTSKLVPLFEGILGQHPIYSAAFGILAFTAGFYYLMFNSMAERIQDSIDDLKDSLDDKANYIDILTSILLNQKNLNEIITRREFERIIQDWLDEDRPVRLERLELHLLIDKDSLNRIARRIGKTDFSKLLISKGLEKEILEEVNTVEGNLPTIGYKLKLMANT
ncbi:MAG TPA: DnaJ domain-containing protein [Bacteroidia bacterium]|nr:DnaJ domain-containing protein [Bacteroidia bacterium]